MEYFDHVEVMKLTQKRGVNRQRRSEAKQRLFWSTYQRWTTNVEPVPQKENHLWMSVRRLLATLRRGWSTSLQTDVRVGQQGSQTHPQISEEGKV
jgi:hypothetical protein